MATLQAWNVVVALVLLTLGANLAPVVAADGAEVSVGSQTHGDSASLGVRHDADTSVVSEAVLSTHGVLDGVRSESGAISSQIRSVLTVPETACGSGN